MMSLNHKMKPTYLALLSLLIHPILIATVDYHDLLAGGWIPIEDLDDPHVKKIAEFAVSEYNKSAKASLKFEKVISGEMTVLSGYYKLVISAIDGSKGSKNYEAVVFESRWGDKRLTSFKPL